MKSIVSSNHTTNSPLNQSLSIAWGDWLETFEPYGWFVSATFLRQVEEGFADRQYLQWIRKINIALFGRRYSQRGLGITHVKSTEWQKRGVIHFHMLLGWEVRKLHRKTWEKVWQEQSIETNGFMRIYPHDVQSGARYYVTKYVSKGGKVDIFVKPILYKNLVTPCPSLPGFLLPG
jgi:hypothetical protein